jgi:hypothetical protein
MASKTVRVLDLREGYEYVEAVSKHVKNVCDQLDFQSYMDTREWMPDTTESEDSMHKSFDWLSENCPGAAVGLIRGMARRIEHDNDAVR